MDYASSVSPNPSSIHALGVATKAELENARSKVAGILHTRTNEIIFTSGGTEGNNLAILGIVSGLKSPHIVTTNIEHPSVLDTFLSLKEKKLAEVTIVPVETSGLIDPKKIKKAIKKNTALVSVMYANNEIGTIQNIREIAKEIRHYNKQNNTKVFFHTDAVQAGNYLDLNVNYLGVDLMTLSGSKIVGAGRVGVLYKKIGVPLLPIFSGGGQEGGLRAGTENVPEILKFANAFLSAQKIKDKESLRLAKLQNYFLKELSKKLGNNFIVNGSLGDRLPNNINITVPNIPSDLLVIELSARGVMASSKSACKAGDGKVSHVIKAINKNIKDTDGSLRFSMGHDTKKEDIDATVSALVEILKKLKKWYN
jgi:cysteine desulfurase